MTTNHPLSIFISSSMHELADERLAVEKALKENKIKGWLWETDAGARPEPIQSTYLKEVEECDLYLGLFWLKYGPYTIEEYEHARKHGKPCLVYEKRTRLDKRNPELTRFLEGIQKVTNPQGFTVCRFETPSQLAEQVQKDVIRLLTSVFRESRKQPAQNQETRVQNVSANYGGIAVGGNVGSITQHNHGSKEQK